MNGRLTVAEWRRGNESLGAARLCLGAKYYADAVSLSYFSVLHVAKAALHSLGISAGSHVGVRGMFGLHIVRAGLVEPKWGAEIGQLSSIREVADYRVTEVIDQQDAREASDRAAAFLDRIHPLLTRSIPPQDLEQPPRSCESQA